MDENERRAEFNRKVDQRMSKDPLTRSVAEQPGGTTTMRRAPTLEMVPKGNTSMEAVDRASRAETAEHNARLEEIPHLSKGGLVKGCKHHHCKVLKTGWHH